MRWSLSRLEEMLGTAGPELVVATQHASDEAIQECAEQILSDDLCPQHICNQLEVWPLFNSRLSGFRTGDQWAESPSLGGLSPLSAADPRFAGRTLFSRSVARVLLYCHGLVLEDPLAVACAIYRDQTGQHEAARAMFNAAVSSAVEISPLVDGGVVIPFWRPSLDRSRFELLLAELRREVEDRRGVAALADEAWDVAEAMYVDGLHPSLREVWRRIRNGDRAPDLRLVEEAVEAVGKHHVLAFLSVVESWNTTVAVDNVAEAVASTLDDAAAMGGEVDFFAPAAMFTRFLLATDPAPQDVDASAIRDLARTDVPGLDDVSWRDVIAMREHEDCFAIWRQQMTAGLREAQTIRAQGMSADTHQCIQEAVAQGRSAILRAQKSSRLLPRSGGPTATFVLGAAGGAIGGATGGTAGITLGAFGGGLSSALPNLINPVNRAPSWLHRHYVAFDKPGGGRSVR